MMAMTSDDPSERLTWWATLKNWLMITITIISILLLFLMLFYGAVFNPDCSMSQMLMFECFRWGAPG